MTFHFVTPIILTNVIYSDSKIFYLSINFLYNAIISIAKIIDPTNPSNTTMDLPSKLIGAMSPNPTVEKTTTLKYNKFPITFIIFPKNSMSPKKPSTWP